MREDEFYICEEDNIFDELSALYEDLKPCPYADAPSLDPGLEWSEEGNYLELIAGDKEVEEAYGVDQVDFQRGDILLASVYQEGRNKNFDHMVRPFVVIYANAYRVYGFQLSTTCPPNLIKYSVEIPNHESCGLKQPSRFTVNMIRGVDTQRLQRRIGHITEEQKQVLLNKLFEIKENKENLYDDCLFNDRIDITIENVERIIC